MKQAIMGVYTAALTPMHKDLSFNRELLVSHCHLMLTSGANGIALLGTTGEANSFSLSERKQIIDAVIEGGIPADKIMVGTGSCAYTETVELTQHALQRGISDVLMLPPFYYKQIDDRGLENYFTRVIEEVGDESLRIFLYHFPKMSTVDLSHALLENLIKKFPAQIAGMKDSSGDLDHMLSIIQNFPSLKLLAGTERHLLSVLRAGGAGCISATANATIKKAVEVFKNWETDRADELQADLTKVRSAFEGMPFTAILKQYLAAHSNNSKWLPVRPPNSHLSQADLDSLLNKLQDLQFRP